MITIRWNILGLNQRAALCATCVWGMVRKGNRAREEETFCRVVGPHSLVSFSVTDCTEYVDRRTAVAEGSARRYGFVAAVRAREEKEVEILPLAESAAR